VLNPEDYLASLNIFRIKVHTPYPIGPVNTYLIKSAPYTLIDTGPDTDEARKTLTEGLAKAGVTPEQIDRVILTHSHTDHSGLAKWLNSISGAQILVHRLEFRKMQPGYDFYKERIPFLLETGLSGPELDEIINDVDPVPAPILPESGFRLVEGGELLEFSDRKLRTVYVPGHSSGHIGLHDEDNQIFFAGDFVLKRITPNPLMEPREPDLQERLPVLSQYLASLETFASTPVKLVLPGHGKLIEGNRETAEKAVRHHKNRLDYYLKLINDREITAWQLMRLAFPGIGGFEGLFMAISEVIAHLDYLVSSGVVDTSKREGVYYYRLKNN